MYIEQVLLGIILWCLCAIIVLTDKQLGILLSVWHGLKAFCKWPHSRRVAFTFFALPFVGLFFFGCVFFGLAGYSAWIRAQPVNESVSYGTIAYQDESAFPRDAFSAVQDTLVRHIIDSLQLVGPIDYDPQNLWPFVVREETIPGKHLTARLLHGRIWCECRTADSTGRGYLPPGTFQLVIFQLFPTAGSYLVMADTVMRWEDYAKPFTLKLPS